MNHIPNTGDFIINANDTGIALICPTCGYGPEWDWPINPHPNLRDLIAAASAHTREHAMSEVRA